MGKQKPVPMSSSPFGKREDKFTQFARDREKKTREHREAFAAHLEVGREDLTREYEAAMLLSPKSRKSLEEALIAKIKVRFEALCERFGQRAECWSEMSRPSDHRGNDPLEAAMGALTGLEVIIVTSRFGGLRSLDFTPQQRRQ